MPNGDYSIIPTEPGMIFTPPIQRITVNGMNVSVPAFSVTPAPQRFAITGRVRDRKGNGLEDITITVKSSSTQNTTITDRNGAYIVNNLPPGKYEVRASSPQYSFPSYWTYDITTTDGWHGDFVASSIASIQQPRIASIQIRPSQVIFPPLQSGLVSSMPIEFTASTSNSQLLHIEARIESTNNTPPQIFSIDGRFTSFTLRPGEKYTLWMQFAPSTSGQFTANLIALMRKVKGS
ncbi:MAG: carboxypeptidase-like regulatory domain-containing protein [Bacteroidota bacterium]|nr:carboxypeptidase-like regulatory domain-containing protein [Candidatus Kapabacteria bacterium]MDW8220037.1 carboxypeptidase-like regulatory domain-containing protein [Bacteroidota bacterium]